MDDLLRAEGFQAALVASALLSAVACAVHRRAPWIGWSLVAVIATAIGLRSEHRLVPTMIWALAFLAVAGWLAGGQRAVLQGAACIPGALLLARVVPTSAPTWTRVVLVVAIALAAPLVLVSDRTLPRVTPALLAVTVIGIWVCVPETGEVHILVGALVPVALVSLVVVLGAPSPPALWPLVGVVLWSAVSGGATRPGAVVGGVACIGVLALVPVVRWRSRGWLDDAVLLTVDAALVLFVARVAGFEESAGPALLLSLLAFTVAGIVLVVAGRVGVRSRHCEERGDG